MEFGKTLSAAREAKGYSVAQLAEVTRMVPTMITDLEQEDFSHIAAPIYGRGFVKLYCEAVDIDPKPLIDEYMAMVDKSSAKGDDRVLRPAHVLQPGKPNAAVDEPPPVVDQPIPEPPPLPQRDLFSMLSGEPEVAKPQTVAKPQPEAKPRPAPQPQVPVQEPLPTVTEKPQTVSRYTAPAQNAHQGLPSAFWRIGALAAGAVVLLVLLFLGLRALRHMTMGQPAKPAPQPAPEVQVNPQPTEPASSAPASPRKPQDIPPLYID